jgi:hypothetical protein
MQLVIETGEALADANSYIDLTDVEKYLPSSVLAQWQGLSEDEQVDRLITASLFIDFSFSWVGQQKTLQQGLSWPRSNVFFQKHKVEDNYIPLQVKRACALAVRLIMQSGLGVFQDTGGAQVKREKLGPLEKEYFESLKTGSAGGSRFSDINNMLRGLFYKPGNVMAAEVLRA